MISLPEALRITGVCCEGRAVWGLVSCRCARRVGLVVIKVAAARRAHRPTPLPAPRKEMAATCRRHGSARFGRARVRRARHGAVRVGLGPGQGWAPWGSPGWEPRSAAAHATSRCCSRGDSPCERPRPAVGRVDQNGCRGPGQCHLNGGSSVRLPPGCASCQCSSVGRGRLRVAGAFSSARTLGRVAHDMANPILRFTPAQEDGGDIQMQRSPRETSRRKGRQP